VEFQSLLEANPAVYPSALLGVAGNDNGRCDNFARMEPTRSSMELHDQPKDCADYVVLRSRYALCGECSMNKGRSLLPPPQLDHEVFTDLVRGTSARTPWRIRNELDRFGIGILPHEFPRPLPAHSAAPKPTLGIGR